MGKLVSLNERQLYFVNKSVEENGEGRLVRTDYQSNSETPKMYVVSGEQYLPNRDVLKTYPGGQVYRIGFFTSNGEFIHASKAKEYLESLQRKYGRTDFSEPMQVGS